MVPEETSVPESPATFHATAAAAVDLIEKANKALGTNGTPIDPLDRVNTGVFSLGDLTPVLDDAQVQALRERLRTDELPADLAIKLFQGIRLLAAALVG